MQTTDIALSNHEAVLVLVGALVPIAGYIFNYFAEGRLERLAAALVKSLTGSTLSAAGRKAFGEAAKALVQVVGTAAVGSIYAAWAQGAHGMGLFKGALTAVVSALFAHNLLWKPSNINVVFGAQPSPKATDEPQAEAVTRAALFTS